ncbi:MAG: patatin-like phospholipase family protein [Acidimicrobiia bacterium]
MDGPRVALALGSGGARGYAHIGAIQVLEERGFEIVGVAGSSMGALVGGLHAAGKLADYTDWVCGLSHLDVLRLLDVSLSAAGAIRAEKIFALVGELLSGALIEELPLPYTAVATDLFARKPVWFQRGPVDVAIRASIAIPGMFTPVMLNGRLLADGGLLDPVPVAPTTSLRADVTIGVSLGGERTGPEEGTPAVESSEERPFEEWADRFRRGAARFLDREMFRSLTSRFGGSDSADADEQEEAPTPEPEGPFEALPVGLGKWDVMNQSLDAMTAVLTRYRLAGYPPDVLVEIPKDACRGFDFHKAAPMIELGRALTTEALDRAGLTGATEAAGAVTTTPSAGTTSAGTAPPPA